MQPLAAATLASLTPRDVDVRFYDDRMEAIPYDEPTDLVRSAGACGDARILNRQQYRRRGVPVVMGGFHPTPARRSGESRGGNHRGSRNMAEVVDDARHDHPARVYRQGQRPSLAGLRPDRSVFRGKRYLPIDSSAGRGCHPAASSARSIHFPSTQTVSRRRYPEEIRGLRHH
jgi:hypothetical protein